MIKRFKVYNENMDVGFGDDIFDPIESYVKAKDARDRFTNLVIFVYEYNLKDL